MKRLSLFVLVFTFACVSAATGTEAVPVMRISIENQTGHFLSRMMRRFVERVTGMAGDRVNVELYDEAKLFRDADVVSALSLGKVEMAVPGISQFDRFAPDIASLMLPTLFGVSEQDVAAVVDGIFGSYLSENIESTLPVVVLGRWMEQGSVYTFFQGKTIRPLYGLRVHVAGGAVNIDRLRALGALPIAIPWPDLPAYFSRGIVDAVLTSYERVLSSKLQAEGVLSVSEMSYYVGYYVPIVNRVFWESLGPETRNAIATAWEMTVDEERLEARAAQADAKKALVDAGLRVFMPTATEQTSVRSTLLAAESDMAERNHVSSQTLEQLRAAFSE